MLWFILSILFALYVVYSLITIKSQLNSIIKHLNIDIIFDLPTELIERVKEEDFLDELNNNSTNGE